MSASEDLFAAHKKERKELLSKIQEMKHSIPKGDKKRKNEVLAEIAVLQSELDSRQEQELSALENTPSVSTGDAEGDLGSENVNAPSDSTKRISKAQKRRDKKVNKMKERDEAIAQQDIENLTGERNVEKEKFDKVLSERGLAIYEVPSDGDCLFKAVEHQLSLLNLQETTVRELRQQTSDYMLTHKDDFIPFLTDPLTGDIMTEERYDVYCKNITRNPTWGGHIEVQALSNVCNASIEVIQAEGPSVIAGDSKPSKLVLSYHRHMYGLGEHYNSVIPKIEDDVDTST